MVDSGTTCFFISKQALPPVPLLGQMNTSVGYSKIVIFNPISERLSYTIGPVTDKHSFVITDKCALNLMGMDLLKRLNTLIRCTP